MGETLMFTLSPFYENYIKSTEKCFQETHLLESLKGELMLDFFLALCRFLYGKQCSKNLLSNSHRDGRTRPSVSMSLEKPK